MKIIESSTQKLPTKTQGGFFGEHGTRKLTPDRHGTGKSPILKMYFLFEPWGSSIQIFIYHLSNIEAPFRKQLVKLINCNNRIVNHFHVQFDIFSCHFFFFHFTSVRSGQHLLGQAGSWRNSQPPPRVSHLWMSHMEGGVVAK